MFAGQAAAELHDDLRLRQLADRFAVAQPQVGARQRLPGLRQDIADQRPAEGLRPLRLLNYLSFQRGFQLPNVVDLQELHLMKVHDDVQFYVLLNAR